MKVLGFPSCVSETSNLKKKQDFSHRYLSDTEKKQSQANYMSTQIIALMPFLK